MPKFAQVVTKFPHRVPSLGTFQNTYADIKTIKADIKLATARIKQTVRDMMNFLRKYQVHILAGLLAFFLIYIALGFGSSFFVQGSPNDTLVEVDGTKIPVRAYWR